MTHRSMFSQSVCRSVRPIYGLMTRVLPVLTFAVLSLSDVSSDDKTDLPFVKFTPLSVFINYVHFPLYHSIQQ
jgi:hypothetical protein